MSLLSLFSCILVLSSSIVPLDCSFPIFFFNDPATTEIYTLSLHDALPICLRRSGDSLCGTAGGHRFWCRYRLPHAPGTAAGRDRKSTRLNSSHVKISYAVFCLKKKIHIILLLRHHASAVPSCLTQVSFPRT